MVGAWICNVLKVKCLSIQTIFCLQMCSLIKVVLSSKIHKLFSVNCTFVKFTFLALLLSHGQRVTKAIAAIFYILCIHKTSFGYNIWIFFCKRAGWENGRERENGREKRKPGVLYANFSKLRHLNHPRLTVKRSWINLIWWWAMC